MELHLLAIIVTVSIFVTLLTSLIIYGRWNYAKLNNCGFPVMKPYFLFGSRPNLHKLNPFQEDIKLFKKYGSIWGLYKGQLPEVYVTDPELIRQIFVRDAQACFQNRDTFVNITHPLIKNMIAIVSGDKWRLMKKSLTPSFTTSKLEGMSKAVTDAVRDTILYVDTEIGSAGKSTFDIQKLFKSLTSDVMARTVFGIKLSSIRDTGNEFMKHLNYLTGESSSNPTFAQYMLKFTFPALFPVPNQASSTMDFFHDFLIYLLEKRKVDVREHNDVLDVLKELTLKLDSAEFKSARIDQDTILAQAMIFVFAGHLVNSTALTLICYVLAKNPAKLHLLHNEIDEFWTQKEFGIIDEATEFSHVFSKLSYLDACISEALRMYHVTERPRRECSSDWSHNGITIRKGTQVIIPVLAVHYNPDYYPDPHEFRPERFLPPQKANLQQFTLHTFGHGQRSCLGTRFFLAQAKLFLVHLLRKYTLECCPETNLSFRPGRTSTVSLQNKLILSISRR